VRSRDLTSMSAFGFGDSTLYWDVLQLFDEICTLRSKSASRFSPSMSSEGRLREFLFRGYKEKKIIGFTVKRSI
jgi:hypothetical protein